MIPLPDPPLRSGDLLLRPWRREDAPALVAAWADPDIQLWTGVPEVRDLAAAERWIAGDQVRRDGGLSLDLVVDEGGSVVGEVGVVPFDEGTRTLELGWWVAPEHRGRHIASSAARRVSEWVQVTLEGSVVARCDAANPASAAVAANAGFHLGWTDDLGEVWVRA